ncbi:MAG: GIY-YIG nuclease family protein, partial [Sarcina sp.]
MKVGLIYMCKNILNNKIYIGQTFSGLENRIKKHYSQLNSDTTHFHRALKKYDKYSLIWGVLEDNILDENID